MGKTNCYIQYVCMYMRIIYVKLTYLCSVGGIKAHIFSYVTVSNRTNPDFRHLQISGGLKLGDLQFNLL